MKKILLLASLMLSLTAFAQIPNYVSADALVAYWPFAGNANDISGNGNNGTVNGAVLTLGHTGGGGDAYYFSSVACAPHIQANINTAPINVSGAMSLSFWIYRVGDGCQGPRVMEFGSCTTCPGQILITWGNGNNTITFRHYLTATSFITYNFSNTTSNNWYHIAYTNDGVTAKYFLNGALVNTTPSPAPVQLEGNTAFGRMNHPANDAFNGNLDDIGLWSRALSSCEITSLYTGNAASSFAFNPLKDTTIICDSIKLDAGPGYSDYKWSNGSLTQTAMLKTKGLHKVTVTNNLGCQATDSTYIDIIKPTITADKMTTCKSGAVVLTATGIAGTSQTLVGGFTESFSAPWTHTINTIAGQQYSMIISGTLSDHCVGGDTYNNADAAYYYDRNPVEKVTQGPGGNAPFRLFTNWNGQPVRPDIDVYNSAHTYTYTLPAATQTSQVFSYADGGGPGSYGDNCGQLSVQVYNIKTSTVTFTWTASPSSTAGLKPADIHLSTLTANPTANTTYYVTVNDGITSCIDSIKITVNTVDTSLTVTDPLKVCSAGGKVNLHAAAGLTNYKWLKDGAAIIGATSSKDYTATAAGVYRVVVTNGQGCSDTSRAVTVIAEPTPVADFTINNATQCLTSNSFVLTNESKISSGSLTYKWDFGDSKTGIAKDTTYSYASANTVANPDYTIQLIAFGNNGCNDTTFKTVVVNAGPAKPVVSAGGPVTICGNGNVELTSDAATGNQWYKDGSAIAAAMGQKYTATVSGAYTVISTINNCASVVSDETIVTINTTPVTPIITPNGTVAICGNGNVILSSDAVTGNQWYADGTLITGATAKTYKATTAATYTVISSINNCASNSSAGTMVSVTPLPARPVITYSGAPAICEGGSLTLTSSAATGNQWYRDGAAVNGAVSQNFAAAARGSYHVVLNNGCSNVSSDPVIITVNPSPLNIRYPAVNVKKGSVFSLQARTFGDSYLWSPSTGINRNDIATPSTNNFQQTQDYIIEIKTDEGCITYDSLLVKAYNINGILVPTAFSPNGDGTNDLLSPILIDIQQLIYFRIYNKWGQLIFETANPANKWDGRYKGNLLSPGSFVWIAQGIDINGNVVNDHGSVTIIR